MLRKVLFGATLVAVVAIALISDPVVLAQSGATRDSNLAMGNPSGATTSTGNQYNYLIQPAEYSLSYNNANRTPNWVSWHLSSAWLGSAPRSDNFRSYPLPTGWYRVTTGSYTGTGFDRGHMCPSGDRTYTTTANSNTFYMINIIPQSPNCNQRAWASLETYCRTLAGQGNEMYIVSGPAGTGGSGSNGFASSIDSGRVKVPSRCWKVILVLPNGSGDVNRVTTSTRTIAVNMPNDQSVGSDWRAYRTSVDAIEALTGYNFFSNVPASIQSVIESRVDNG